MEFDVFPWIIHTDGYFTHLYFVITLDAHLTKKPQTPHRLKHCLNLFGDIQVIIKLEDPCAIMMAKGDQTLSCLFIIDILRY